MHLIKLKIVVGLITTLTLFCGSCWGQTLTAEEFSWKLIENSLNLTKNTENFVIAPYEAYQLYKQIFQITEQSDESLTSEENDDAPEMTTLRPAIGKQQKIWHLNKTNEENLLSSVTLTARWSFNFQTRDTHKRIFHQQGKTNQNIWADFLRKDDTFSYTHDEQLNASILELPLNVKAIKLKIILPDEWDALPRLKQYLLENMEDFQELLKKSYRMTLVRVLLPKFRLSYKQDLTDIFKEISEKHLEKYDKVYQASNLEFNERGIGRFERTTVLFWNSYSYLRVSPELFDVTHPFLFVISNKDGIQFFGQVVKMQN